MSTVENAALLALVALLPLVVLTLSSFVKVSVVLSLLRNALGAPDAPSGLVITGLSLVLTFFVMAPVAIEMVEAAGAPMTPGPMTPGPMTPGPVTPGPVTPGPMTPGPMTPGPMTPAPDPATPGAQTPATDAPSQIDVLIRTLVPAKHQGQVETARRALGPLRAFLVKHTRQADRETFRELAAGLGNEVLRGDELWVLAPAFIATELREAFMIAVLIFVPFLVIDLVVGLGLAALGLQMTSPQTVALPLKLVLFVAVDGWRLLLDGLLRGYV
jgi:type III secretion protein R